MRKMTITQQLQLHRVGVPESLTDRQDCLRRQGWADGLSPSFHPLVALCGRCWLPVEDGQQMAYACGSEIVVLPAGS